VNQPSIALGTRFVFVCLGLFGAAFAITGLLVALPRPAAGGTCGPGQGSEAAVVALLDPITIGAGPEPAATDATGRTQWSAFIHECQTAADDRVLAALPILIVSAGVAIFGPLVVRRRTCGRVSLTPETTVSEWSPPPGMAPSTGHAPSAGHDAIPGISDVAHVTSGAPLLAPKPEPDAGFP
jgi:hypothetical protein